MSGKLFNFKLDKYRYDKLKKESEDSKKSINPTTMTGIVIRALDLRWEKLKQERMKKVGEYV